MGVAERRSHVNRAAGPEFISVMDQYSEDIARMVAAGAKVQVHPHTTFAVPSLGIALITIQRLALKGGSKQPRKPDIQCASSMLYFKLAFCKQGSKTGLKAAMTIESCVSLRAGRLRV